MLGFLRKVARNISINILDHEGKKLLERDELIKFIRVFKDVRKNKDTR